MCPRITVTSEMTLETPAAGDILVCPTLVGGGRFDELPQKKMGRKKKKKGEACTQQKVIPSCNIGLLV